MCTCSLAISIGAATLLPFSVIGSEILQAYPDSYYFKWLNWPLIHSLWDYVFALSNLSLFILLPFAYFFIESQGFRGQGKSQQKSISLSLLSFTSVDLPFIYSFGRLFHTEDDRRPIYEVNLISGFARMFTVVSDHLLASNSIPVTDPCEHVVSRLEYETQKLRLMRSGFSANSLTPPEPFLPQKPLRGYQKVLQSVKYPLAIVLLLLLTAVSVLMVVINTLQLLFGYRALPVYAQYIEVNSRHTLGIFGALIEVVIIWYVMVASLVGVYSVPILRRLRPRKGKTTMTFIIANCTTVLVLSSALPVLAKTLGITTFDLLGAYGSFNWLSNFTLVWTYNVAFAAATVSCLVNHFTAPVRREFIRR
ncbi:unnamed protein product [Toxocara canis]|uniref:Protein LMBR1L n=1 Tax=Toxocara canis TaxID=6265 RepID=A0A183VC64_TOXCA|nr:unnamed protein product [Toxocara canis]